MKNILFLCTGNSCRSQMAEGWGRKLLNANVYSAGTEPQGLNPYAVKVMAELGVDISTHSSKNVSELSDIDFDYVYTVCGNADKNCPVFPGKSEIIHHGFDDPPHLAQNLTDEDDILKIYKRVALEIKDWVSALGF